MRRALEGRITPHHRFMLKLLKESIEDREKLVCKLEEQIDIAAVAYQVEIELLQTIDGVGKDSAVTIISEIGADMGVFPNEHHLSSWAGMSPGNNESGGKKKYPDHPRQQTPSISLSRVWLGSYQKKRRIFKTQIRKPCSKAW